MAGVLQIGRSWFLSVSYQKVKFKVAYTCFFKKSRCNQETFMTIRKYIPPDNDVSISFASFLYDTAKKCSLNLCIMIEDQQNAGRNLRKACLVLMIEIVSKADHSAEDSDQAVLHYGLLTLIQYWIQFCCFKYEDS